MQYRFTDPDVGTERFFERSLMGDEYDPPGIRVHRDDDGVPWFRVRKESADAFDADPRFERYGASADGADGDAAADDSGD